MTFASIRTTRAFSSLPLSARTACRGLGTPATGIRTFAAPGQYSCSKSPFEFNPAVEFLDCLRLSLDEFRNGVAGNSAFPPNVTTQDTASLALVFHPCHR